MSIFLLHRTSLGIDSLRRLYGVSTDESWMVLAPFPSIPKIQGIANLRRLRQARNRTFYCRTQLHGPLTVVVEPRLRALKLVVLPMLSLADRVLP